MLDWVQDAAKEQLRRKVRRKETAGFFERGGHAGWRYKLGESYEAAQGWIVVTLIGIEEQHLYRREVLIGDRRGHWDECRIPEYHH